MSYLISVIIPTKNRFKYCLAAINSCLKLQNEKIQIIVQDNSDASNEEVIKELLEKNSNIKYNYHSGVLSFIENFNEAVSLADGKYLCMIGDDDAVLPNIITETENMQKNDIDALIPGLNSVYIWPSEKPFVKGAENGYLCIDNIKKKQKYVNSRKAIKDLMATGGQNYQQHDIPRLYHGIVKVEKLLEIKNVTKHYFGGLTPDIYNATCLCYVCDKVLRLNYPITVSGICPTSGSADSATGRHTGKLEDAPHFRGHASYEWDNKAPAIYSVESIWGETVLKALKDFNDIKSYDKFSVLYLDAICLRKYPQFKNEIVEHAKKYKINLFSLKLKSNIIFLNQFVKKAIKKVFKKKNSVLKLYNIEQIENAVEITMSEIGKKL